MCHKWDGIGLSLLVRGRDEIKKRFPNDPLKCLIGVLTNWLQLQYHREKDPELPSWKKLATVVGENAGGANPRKGEYIAQNYKGRSRLVYQLVLTHNRLLYSLTPTWGKWCKVQNKLQGTYLSHSY